MKCTAYPAETQIGPGICVVLQEPFGCLHEKKIYEHLLSCQPRVTVTLCFCFVYKFIRDL